jgi:aerobic carbon-monoxide dehydrogenase small subunit
MAEQDSAQERVSITAVINGRSITRTVPPRTSLALFLREEIGATSVHLGCEHGVCGACTVLYDGICARSCLLLAPQADGATIETLEGVSETPLVAELQQEFVERAALQCGFCTPGMLLTAAELLERTPSPDREAIRDGLSGNICRCTGYQSIVDAVEAVAASRSRDAADKAGD